MKTIKQTELRARRKTKTQPATVTIRIFINAKLGAIEKIFNLKFTFTEVMEMP